MGFRCIGWIYSGTFLECPSNFGTVLECPSKYGTWDTWTWGLRVLVGHIQVHSWSVQVIMVHGILGHGFKCIHPGIFLCPSNYGTQDTSVI